MDSVVLGETFLLHLLSSRLNEKTLLSELLELLKVNKGTSLKYNNMTQSDYYGIVIKL